MMTENNKIRPLVTMITAALLSSSCSLVGPDYVKPEAEVEPKWINQSSPEISKRTAELSTWWKVFKDPVLDKLVTEARQQNLSLQVAGTRILEARAQLGIATSAEYPQLQQVNGDLSQQQFSAFAPNTSSISWIAPMPVQGSALIWDGSWISGENSGVACNRAWLIWRLQLPVMMTYWSR